MIDPDLFDIMVDGDRAGLSAADTASKVVDAMRARDAADAKARDDDFWRTLRECART